MWTIPLCWNLICLALLLVFHFQCNSLHIQYKVLSDSWEIFRYPQGSLALPPCEISSCPNPNPRVDSSHHIFLIDIPLAWLAMHFYLSFSCIILSLTCYRKVQAHMCDSDNPNTPRWYSPTRGTGEAKEGPGCTFFLISQIPRGNSLTFLYSSLLTCPSAHNGWGWKTGLLCSFVASSSILFPYPNLEGFSSLKLWQFIFPFKSSFLYLNKDFILEDLH